MLGLVLKFRILPALIIISLLELCRGASDLRVVGGKGAEPNEFPYVGRMEVRCLRPHISPDPVTFTLCTAAALTSSWVLTAAHCVKNFKRLQKDFKDIRLTGIITYKSTFEDPNNKELFTEIIEERTFPSYRSFSGAYGEDITRNDVAVLKTNPIELTRFAKLSAIDFKTLAGQGAMVVGFGKTREGDELKSTRVLRKPLQSVEVIIKNCEDVTSLLPNMCLSPRCGRLPSICGGDSGGPLIHASGIVGVNSQGTTIDCDIVNIKEGRSSGEVGYITPISPFVDWIGEIISKG